MAQPDHYRTYLNLGLALQAEDLLDEAIDANTKAISIKPDYSEALNNLGVLYREIGRWSSAVSCYEQAIDADPFMQRPTTTWVMLCVRAVHSARRWSIISGR